MFENTQKLSYKVILDTRPQEIDEQTNLPVKAPIIFSDSFMDDPQNYLYAKVSRETRKNSVGH